jgi:serine/threonine protein kinase
MKDALKYFYDNELKLWERVEHAHVVKIFEVFDDGSRGGLEPSAAAGGHNFIYLLMEYADLGTLMRWVDKESKYLRNEGIYKRVEERIS